MANFEICDNCKYNMKLLHEEPCCKCNHGVSLKDFFEPKTNADRIRAMSDEELEEFFDNTTFCPQFEKCDKDGCQECVSKWLKSERRWKT